MKRGLTKGTEGIPHRSGEREVKTASKGIRRDSSPNCEKKKCDCGEGKKQKETDFKGTKTIPHRKKGTEDCGKVSDGIYHHSLQRGSDGIHDQTIATRRPSRARGIND